VSTAPVTADGIDGEYRLVLSTNMLYGPKATTWPAGVEFGATGADGEDGENGTSFDLAVATTEPADGDKVAGTLYAIRGTTAPASYATVGGRTYTAAELIAGLIVRDCAGASRTDTLPTAALLVAALTNPVVGQRVDCAIVNGSDANEVITIAAGTGGSFATNQTTASRIIPQNATKVCRIRLTNVGSGTETYAVYL
jgi:hypothetical protein